MDTPNKEKPVVDLSPQSPQTVSNDGVQLFSILGMFEVIDYAPTTSPTSIYQQIKLYVNDLTTPTVFGMWVYFPKVQVWHFFSTSTGPSASPSLSPSFSPSLSTSPSLSPSKSPSKSPSISPSVSPS